MIIVFISRHDHRHSLLLPRYAQHPHQTPLPQSRIIPIPPSLCQLARSTTLSRSARSLLLSQSISEAEKAIFKDPHGAAPHILKSLALELQGCKQAALHSIDVALSPLAKKLFSCPQRGDALVKRAELKKGVKVDSAIVDLVEAVRICEEGKKGKTWRLLGECCEMKETTAEAKAAYDKAVANEPELTAAKVALHRLN